MDRVAGTAWCPAGRHRGAHSSVWIALWLACVCSSPETVGQPRAIPTDGNTLVLAHAILNRWEPMAVRAGAHWNAWREVFLTQLSRLDASILRELVSIEELADADATTQYARFARAVRDAEMQAFTLSQSGKRPLKLGSANIDKVYIPVAPCRVVDTRNAGGPITAGETRNYLYYATSGTFTWSNQGGTPGMAGTACPATVNPDGTVPAAAMVTVTVVSPSAAGNWIIWGGASPKPTISALNWNAGDIKANTTIIPAGGHAGVGPGGAVLDFAVGYNGPSGRAHFVADVVGYFVENRATALQCYETAVQSLAIGSGASRTVGAPACPAGYALTGGNCDSDSYTANTFDAQYYIGPFPQAHWTCTYHNSSGATSTIYASSICCRVPGR